MRRNSGLLVPELLTEPDRLAKLLDVLRRPIRGAAIDLLAGLAQATGNIALSTTPSNLFGVNATPLAIPTGGQGFVVPDPWGIAIAYVPLITGVAAGATGTLALINQAGAQIGNAPENNQGAGASPIGPLCGVAPLRGDNVAGIARTTAINATGTMSTSTGTATFSATAPGLLVALSFLS